MKQLKYNLIMLGYVFRAAPVQAILLIAAEILGGLKSAASLWLIKLLFDRLEVAYTTHDTDLIPFFLIAAAMAGIHLLSQALYSLNNRVTYPKLLLKLHYTMHEQLYQKAIEIDLHQYDDPAFYNDFIWAMQESDSRAISIFISAINALYGIIGITGISAVLFTVDGILLPIGIGVLLCTFILDNISRKVYVRQSEKIMPYSRHMSYINRVFYLQDYVKELRTSDIGTVCMQQYDEDVQSKIKTIKHYAKIYMPLVFAQTLISTGAINGFIIIYVVYKILVEKSLSLGGFAVSVNAIQSLYRTLQTLLYSISNIRENGMYAEKFCKFIEQKPTITDKAGALPLQGKAIESLELKHLTFCYPGTDKKVIDDISLNISRHEKIAFVGYNGAGKTTLIKLITRLYEPTGGQILVNGKDIRDYKIDSYRKSFGTVFQDFQIFSASIAENVMNGPFAQEYTDRVLSSLRAVQLEDRLYKTQKGIETTLTREFDDEGTILSGGQTQKIAIARVFAGDFDFVILDEPSSALDPVTEYELNQTMMAAAYNKTVIFISHRLSTTRMCDRIYMFENGRIIEIGSHDQLMEQNGKYAEMFRLQAKNYQI